MAFSLPSFPVDVLPEKLACFVRSASQSLCCPPDFIGTFALTVLSSAIGTSRYIRIKPDWIEPPVLYTAVVALPASKKSPALKLTLSPVKEKQVELRKEYNQEKAQYEVELEIWQKNKKDTPRPTKPKVVRNFINDFTFEALAKILSYNKKGLLLGLDELAAWIKSMDQYRQGQGADREKWLSLWTCSNIVIDRASLDEPIFISDPFVCVTGGLQPDRLKLFQGRENDGFLDRVLFSFPEQIPDEWVEDFVSPAVLMAYKKLYNQLFELSSDHNAQGDQTRILDFTKEAKTGYINFFSQNNSDINSEADLNLKAAFKKMDAYTARFALLLQLCQNADSLQLEAEAVEGAAILAEYFKAHARKVYAQLKGQKVNDQILKAIQTLRAFGNEITLRECYTKRVGGCKNSEEARKLFNELKKEGIGEILEKKNSSGGRATVIFRLKN